MSMETSEFLGIQYNVVVGNVIEVYQVKQKYDVFVSQYSPETGKKEYTTFPIYVYEKIGEKVLGSSPSLEL